MNFISISFGIFLAVTVILYFIVPLKYRWIVLLLASLSFYAFSGKEALVLMLASSFVAYIAARRMEHIYAEELQPEEDKKSAMLRKKKKCHFVLNVALVVILGVLAIVKAARFMPQSVAAYIIVPLGISYYTFSVVAYLADVYWKKHKAESNFFKFTLFVAFFPKILQGPISRYKNLAPQLFEGHTFDYQRFCFGLQLILWGIFKKIVIADHLAIFTDSVFGNWQKNSGSMLLVAAVFAVFQLYCDFSGCMDMASGMSEIFGIELEQNFNHPFFSKSASEFWRRWHITLGTWFKDYIYMPIVVSPRLIKIVQPVKKKCGMRAGKSIMLIVPLLVVWLLTGIWHGTGKPYVVWGLYWGLIIILSSVFEPELKRFTKFLRINVEAGSWKVFQMVRTFFLFCIGRVITIPDDLHATAQILKKFVADFQPWQLMDQTLYGYGLDQREFYLIILSLLLLWVISLIQEKGEMTVRERIANWNIVFRWGFYYIVVAVILIFGVYGPGYDAAAFVYMQF